MIGFLKELNKCNQLFLLEIERRTGGNLGIKSKKKLTIDR